MLVRPSHTPPANTINRVFLSTPPSSGESGAPFFLLLCVVAPGAGTGAASNRNPGWLSAAVVGAAVWAPADGGSAANGNGGGGGGRGGRRSTLGLTCFRFGIVVVAPGGVLGREAAVVQSLQLAVKRGGGVAWWCAGGGGGGVMVVVEGWCWWW